MVDFNYFRVFEFLMFFVISGEWKVLYWFLNINVIYIKYVCFCWCFWCFLKVKYCLYRGFFLEICFFFYKLYLFVGVGRIGVKVKVLF